MIQQVSDYELIILLNPVKGFIQTNLVQVLFINYIHY